MNSIWYILALASSFVMGISTIWEKKALREEHASAYSSSFSIVTAIISLVFIPFANFNISPYILAVIYISSIFSTAGYLLNARTFRHGNISVSSPIFSSFPMLFVVIFASVFLGERVKTIQYVGIASMIIFTYALLFKSDSKEAKSFEKPKYRYLLILSSLFNAAGAVLMKYALGYVNAFTYIIIAEFFVAVNMNVYMQIKYNGIREAIGNILINKKDIIPISALTTIYRILYYFSASIIAISLAAPLRNTIYVIITTFFGGMFFKEKNLAYKLVFSALILFSAYLIVV
ncbi:MAG: DMT family transporter [Candidatus Micrarchaeaceae archaeon]